MTYTPMKNKPINYTTMFLYVICVSASRNIVTVFFPSYEGGFLSPLHYSYIIHLCYVYLILFVFHSGSQSPFLWIFIINVIGCKKY